MLILFTAVVPGLLSLSFPWDTLFFTVCKNVQTNTNHVYIIYYFSPLHFHSLIGYLYDPYNVLTRFVIDWHLEDRLLTCLIYRDVDTCSFILKKIASSKKNHHLGTFDIHSIYKKNDVPQPTCSRYWGQIQTLSHSDWRECERQYKGERRYKCINGRVLATREKASNEKED